MKKTIKTLLALTVLSASVNSAFAQSYLGLNYPKPEVDRAAAKGNTPAPQLENLLSDKIRETGAAAQKESVSPMRRQALSDLGLELGSSNGLVFRMNQIKDETNKSAARLDRLFDFSDKNKVLLEDGVLSPVLTEGQSNYSQNSDDEVRIADKIYKIEAPARFVSVYPTWRSYINFSYPTYEMPPAAFLPTNADEKAIWDAAVKEGWKKGVAQADRMFEADYNRLVRDYQGMVKYKILLGEGLITPTIIAKQNLGVTGGGKEMAVNDQVFRITDHSALNPNKSQWKVEYPVTNNVNGVLK